MKIAAIKEVLKEIKAVRKGSEICEDENDDNHSSNISSPAQKKESLNDLKLGPALSESHTVAFEGFNQLRAKYDRSTSTQILSKNNLLQLTIEEENGSEEKILVTPTVGHLINQIGHESRGDEGNVDRMMKDMEQSNKQRSLPKN